MQKSLFQLRRVQDIQGLKTVGTGDPPVARCLSSHFKSGAMLFQAQAPPRPHRRGALKRVALWRQEKYLLKLKKFLVVHES